MRYTIAFDPGVNNTMPGGWSVFCGDICTRAEEMPRAGKIVDVPYLVREIISECGIPDLVVVEKQHGRPQDGIQSLNIMLPAYGQLVGMCQAMCWSLKIVDPKSWKAVVLHHTKRDKAAACAYVSQRYPHVDLRPGRRRKEHDGIADAVCIGAFGSILPICHHPAS